MLKKRKEEKGAFEIYLGFNGRDDSERSKRPYFIKVPPKYVNKLLFDFKCSIKI